MPKVSVVIPIYNVEKYIERCARALFEQTLDDIEYVFVNDCTPDDSMYILNTVIEEYPLRKDSIKITTTPHNSGLPTARKTGIPLTTGEYIAHCDSDDWPEPTMYEKLYNIAKANDADIVYCDYYRTTDKRRKRLKQHKTTKLMTGPIWNKLLKSSLCKDNYIIYPTANKAEDGALVLIADTETCLCKGLLGFETTNATYRDDNSVESDFCSALERVLVKKVYLTLTQKCDFKKKEIADCLKQNFLLHDQADKNKEYYPEEELLKSHVDIPHIIFVLLSPFFLC